MIASPAITEAEYLKRYGHSKHLVLDPETGRAWVITEQGYLETRDRILRTTDGAVSMPLSEVSI